MPPKCVVAFSLAGRRQSCRAAGNSSAGARFVKALSEVLGKPPICSLTGPWQLSKVFCPTQLSTSVPLTPWRR